MAQDPIKTTNRRGAGDGPEDHGGTGEVQHGRFGPCDPKHFRSDIAKVSDTKSEVKWEQPTQNTWDKIEDKL